MSKIKKIRKDRIMIKIINYKVKANKSLYQL